MTKTLPGHFHYNLTRWFFLSMLVIISIRLSAQPFEGSIFKDDFDRAELGAFWQANPSWYIQNGSAYNFIDGTGGTLRTTNNFDEPSYIIETKALGFTDNYMREYRITFGQPNLSKDSMYVLSYQPYNGGVLTLGRSYDNIYFPETLDESVIYPELNSAEWYKFKIAKYKSGLIQVYIDKGSGYGNTPFLEAIDSTYINAGHIGWQIDTETFAESFYVDNISAVRPDKEKPAVREKPAEDNLVTQVYAKSGNAYKVAKLNEGVKEYTDRDINITSVPDYLQGASFVQTVNDDKRDVSDTFLTLFVKKAAVVYIGYDTRGTIIPDWLNDWTKTGDSIGTNNNVYLQVYSKLIENSSIYPNPFFLGGNLAGHAYGSEANYLIAAVERPEIVNLQAEDAVLSGAVATNKNPGYNGTGYADFVNASKDYIEWTVKIDVPGTYNLGFNFTNGGASDRPLRIDNNGVSVGKAFFSSTSSWSWWAYYSGPHVFLSRGIHKIRATAIGFSGPNIDELSLYYESSANLTAIAKKDVRDNDVITHLYDKSFKAYPNPFTKSTKILYSLKERKSVILSVYTMQGQRVQTLVNSIQNPGDYQVTFDAGKLATGTYLYQLQAGNEVRIGKLIKD